MTERPRLRFFDECQVLGVCHPLCPSAQKGNQLEEIEGLDDQKSLQVLNLSSNRIVSMSGLQSLQLLCSLNLEKNLVQNENFQTSLMFRFFWRRLSTLRTS